MCRGHVDVTLKLSAALPDVPGACRVCNAHGVRQDFLAIGAAAAALPPAEAAARFDGGAYFLAKAIWTKGYKQLLEGLGEAAGDATATAEAADAADLPAVQAFACAPVHTFGSGRDAAAIRAAADAGSYPVVVHEGIDHAAPALRSYRVFVNPSTSEVLCTATAEALAMGKKVLIPDHPSNSFFRQFANAQLYDPPPADDDADGGVSGGGGGGWLVPLLAEALATPPVALSPHEQYLLSWEAATERLIDAARLPRSASPRADPRHALAYGAHWAAGMPPLGAMGREFAGAEE